MAKGSFFLKYWAKLYTAPTKSELALEPSVAALGVPYRAQHPVFALGFICDFALLDEKIILEVDGKSHSGKAAQEADRERTRKLERLGWVVARCRNEDAEREPKATVQKMLMEARDRREALKLLKLIAKETDNDGDC
jgi:very-short-patch-repair endonuclease